MKPPRPCIERGCTEYAIGGQARCAGHVETVKRTGGQTTPAWRKARTEALRRAGNRCEKCGRTAAQAKAAGTWLEVHHLDGRGKGAPSHDDSLLRVLCRKPCHEDTLGVQHETRSAPSRDSARKRWKDSLRAPWMPDA